MDLQQIKYFLAVVDCGTFLAASKQVYVSQPTLSAGIRKLEESLNVTLFHRGSRAASLTSAGERFLGPARQAYNQLQAIKGELVAQPVKIVIGVLTNIHMDQVAGIIGHYRMSHPHIQLELVVAGHDELAGMLAEGKVDLLITNSDTRAEHFVPLFEERLCVVTASGHPLGRLKAVELKALSGELFIERTRCGFWQPVNDAFRDRQIQPHTVMQAENDEFVLALVAQDLGVSIITDRATPYDVCFVPIKDLTIDRRIGLCMPLSSGEPHLREFYHAVLGHYGIESDG